MPSSAATSWVVGSIRAPDRRRVVVEAFDAAAQRLVALEADAEEVAVQEAGRNGDAFPHLALVDLHGTERRLIRIDGDRGKLIQHRRGGDLELEVGAA